MYWMILGVALILVVCIGWAAVVMAGIADDELERRNCRDDHPTGR